MFSSRLPPRMAPNAIGAAVARARRSGQVWLDLTETNPTRVGLPYPDRIISSLASPDALMYAPDSLGTEAARVAIVEFYRRRGRVVSPGRMLLTASTSEAYAMLFKLLCAPGDAVLIPQPSYPLFELLTALEAVDARPYRLDPHNRWAIDRASLEHACGSRTRAVLIVSPNNPTGSVLAMDDRAWLLDFCAARELALIVDEVFADYPLRVSADEITEIQDPRVLVCALGGLSKSAGLPQMKLAWTLVSGPVDRCEEAMTRLEMIADTYLSVNTPVQVALPALIDAGVDVHDAILARVRRNLAALERAAGGWPAVTVMPPDAGWSVVMRVPATETEEQLVVRVFTEAGVLVHPGYFYDFDREAHLVLSLLPHPDIFDRAVARLLPLVGGEAA